LKLLTVEGFRFAIYAYITFHTTCPNILPPGTCALLDSVVGVTLLTWEGMVGNNFDIDFVVSVEDSKTRLRENKLRENVGLYARR
jgi:hypothetical protein